MPTKVVRKLHGAGEGNGGNGHGDRDRVGSAQKAGDGKVMLVSQEIMRLLDASREGRLTERGRVDQFDGVYREIMQGINEMLDAILLPIGEGTAFSARLPTAKSTK